MDSQKIFKPFDQKEVRKLLDKQADIYTDSDTDKKTKEEVDKENQEAMDQPIVGYRIMEKMGSGGTAVVFKAENISNNQIIALKLLYPGKTKNKRVLEQFINDGMMLMRFRHPNILEGIDFGISKEMYFLALELVKGQSLDTFLDKGYYFTEKDTFRVAYQIAKALEYLNKNNVVHRDVKPANIILMEKGVVKLCDFAYALDISRLREFQGKIDFTCGTVEYISPEQAQGSKKLDIRSDIYSLGMTCIHMLTSKVPFTGKPREIMQQQIFTRINLKDILKISKNGRLIIQKMISKSPDDRMSASELVILLKKMLVQLSKKKKS